MATISEKVTIQADRETVFTAYTEKIGEWWPWRGTYKYTFAPEGIEPEALTMETEEGGRFYETWSDGTEHQIGTVRVWKPHDEVAYSWEVADWPEVSIVTVRFVSDGDTTTVIVEHENLPDEGTAMGYSTGQKEILGTFAAYVEENRS